MDQMLFKKHVIHSGLTVYFQHRDIPWFQACLTADAGQRRNPPNKIDLAHYVEHMLHTSTIGLKQRDMGDLENWLRKKGVLMLLGSTGIDEVSYGGKTLTKQDDFFFRFLNALVRKPRLNDKFEDQREIIRAEKIDAGESRIHQAQRKRRIKVFGPGSLALGDCWAENPELDSLTPDDVCRFHRDNYGLADMNLIVCGGLDENRLLQLTERYFQPHSNEPLAKERPKPLSFNPKNRQCHWCRQSKQAEVSVVELDYYWHLPPIRTAALNVLSESLESLLMLELREENKFLYDVSVGVDYFTDHSILQITTRTSPGNIRKVMKVVENVLHDPPNMRKEIARAKKRMVLNLELCEFSIDETVNEALSDIVIGENPETIVHSIKAHQRAKYDSVIVLLENEINLDRVYLQITEW